MYVDVITYAFSRCIVYNSVVRTEYCALYVILSFLHRYRVKNTCDPIRTVTYTYYYLGYIDTELKKDLSHSTIITVQHSA